MQCPVPNIAPSLTLLSNYHSADIYVETFLLHYIALFPRCNEYCIPNISFTFFFFKVSCYPQVSQAWLSRSPILIYLIVILVGVHCGIYTTSYNISYLNLPLPPFSFFLPHPVPEIVSTDTIFPFTYTIAPYSSSYTIFSPPPRSHWYTNLPRQDLFLFHF
jgi:hypothetical protein